MSYKLNTIIAKGKVMVDGLGEREITLYKVDTKNKAFGGYVNVLGRKLDIRNTQENKLTLDNIKELTFIQTDLLAHGA